MASSTTSSSKASSIITLQSALDIALSSNKYYLGDSMWWNFVQEQPTPVGKKKRANKQIIMDGQSYKIFMTYAVKCMTCSARTKVFSYLPTKKSDVIKKIGEAILEKRFGISRADMNNRSDTTMIPFMKETPTEVKNFMY